MTDDARLTDAWLQLQENWWASEEIDRLCDSDPERAWAVVSALVERAPTREILETVAAGPLEDLVRAHASKLIDKLEFVAATDRRWGEALAIVRVPISDAAAAQRLFALGCQRVPNFDAMPAAEFLTSVREFVKLLESDTSAGTREFLATCGRLLSLIYAHAWLLPAGDPDTSGAEPTSAVSPSVEGRLGGWDVYFSVFDPLEMSEPVTASLADDLSELFEELASPLRAFEAGRHADAIWSWRFSLQGHAGHHLVSALRAIHQILQRELPAT